MIITDYRKTLAADSLQALWDDERRKYPRLIKLIEDARGYIAGGAIVSCLLEERPRDLDVFFPEYPSRVVDYLTNLGIEINLRQPTEENPGPNSYATEVGRLHLVLQFFFKAFEQVSTFDFEHCKWWWYPNTTRVYNINEVAVEQRFMVEPKPNQHASSHKERLMGRGWKDHPWNRGK